jgi:hypothetical protein
MLNKAEEEVSRERLREAIGFDFWEVKNNETETRVRQENSGWAYGSADGCRNDAGGFCMVWRADSQRTGRRNRNVFDDTADVYEALFA